MPTPSTLPPILDSSLARCYTCPHTKAQLNTYDDICLLAPSRLFVTFLEFRDFARHIFPEFVSASFQARALETRARKIGHPMYLISLVSSFPNQSGGTLSTTTTKDTWLYSLVSAIGTLDTWSIYLHNMSYSTILNAIRDVSQRSEVMVNYSISIEEEEQCNPYIGTSLIVLPIFTTIRSLFCHAVLLL